jgi:glycosyltransferase involved in cell wall biosynthesis
MSLLDDVTPLLLTWNEEPNIGRALERLEWAPAIVVVDSGSTDGTLAILRAHPKVRIVSRPFTTHAEQWSFGLAECGIATEWVLALDADHLLDAALVDELRALAPPPDVAGYVARFVYWSLGRRLRGSLYPPKVVLFRRSAGRFVQDGHTQRLLVEGRTAPLTHPIHHDDRKGLSRWLSAQDAYARLEADRIARGPASWLDRLRMVGLGPVMAAAYALVFKGAALDGRAGAYYAMQRAVAEALIALQLWGRR